MSTHFQDSFGLAYPPFSKRYLHQNPVETAGVSVIKKRCEWLLEERGIGVLTGPSGVGKTAVLARQLRDLPNHRYRVVYLEDSSASSNDIFRTLAYKLDLEPAFRRATLWRELKERILKLDEENDQQVIIVIDDAHRLSSAFLNSLGAFMNFAFDSRDILTLWLVGDRRLIGTLQMVSQRHILTRVRMRVHLDAFNYEEFQLWTTESLANAGCTRQIITHIAMDAAFQLSRGVPRTAAKIFSIALRLAHEKGEDLIDDKTIEDASNEVLL